MRDEICAQHADTLQRLCGVTERMDGKFDRVIEQIGEIKKTQDGHAAEIAELKKSVALVGWTRKGIAMFAASGAMIGVLGFFSGLFKTAVLWVGSKL